MKRERACACQCVRLHSCLQRSLATGFSAGCPCWPELTRADSVAAAFEAGPFCGFALQPVVVRWLLVVAFSFGVAGTLYCPAS